MINPPSAQKPFDEFWSGDPSFVQAPADPPEDASPDDVARHKALVDEYRHKLDLARETGDWSGLRVAGAGEPSRFTCLPVKGALVRWMHEQITTGKLSTLQVAALTFRACVVGMENVGAFKIEHEHHEHLGAIATRGLTDYLDSVHMGIVTEIGLRLYSRGTRGLSPKS
jgi:hypothetical protein